VPAPVRPSYEVLDMAFGVGAGTTLFDKSRYRSHGAITTATWAAGLHGYCLNFVAANPDYVVIPAAHAQLDFTVEDFSIITRVYVDILAVTSALINRGQFNASGYRLIITPINALEFTTFQAGPSQTSASAAATIVAATWYTLGMSRAGASVRIYINGLDATVAAGVHNNPLTNVRDAVIGTYDNLAAWQLDGRMEFLRIFRGVALQPSEHLAWHNFLA